jgi:cell division protein FtsL
MRLTEKLHLFLAPGRKAAKADEDLPTKTIVTLPRSRRRSGKDPVAERLLRRRPSASVEGRPHGWGRADDQDRLDTKLSFLERRRADGTPLLLFTVLAVLTGVGLARVESRIEILDLANEITELSEDQQRLLDRKRRIETERAYLRRPARISEQAAERLGMAPAPPERIQPIELLPAAPEPESESESEPQNQESP